MKEHLIKIGKGAAVAAIGAALAVAAPALMDLSYSFEVKGQIYDLTPVVIVILQVGVNVVRKALGL